MFFYFYLYFLNVITVSASLVLLCSLLWPPSFFFFFFRKKIWEYEVCEGWLTAAAAVVCGVPQLDCWTLALVMLSNCDLEAVGSAVNVVLVVVIMCEAAGGCSLLENSSWCNVTCKLGSCWQQSAAAVAYWHRTDFGNTDTYKDIPDEGVRAHMDTNPSGLKCPIAVVCFVQ